MKQQVQQIDPKILKRFSIFEGLTPDQLGLLAQNMTVHRERAGRKLFERGSTDNWTYLLLDGELEAQAADGVKWVIAAGSDKAKTPIAQLKPRQYDVRTLAPARLLRIDEVYLGKLLKGGGMASLQVDPEAEGSRAVAGELFYELYQELNQDRLRLPSLPNLALRIRRTIDARNAGADAIARVVSTDPAITAKLIKTANSPLYRGRSPIDNCASAIIRLGTDTTRQLIVSFVMRDLFRTRSPVLKDRMETLWRNSTLVAAICFVLARRSGHFDPEKAMLVGLLHDIGVVPLISYAEKYPDITTQPDKLEGVVSELRGQIGAMILRKWEFPDEFVEAARGAEDWNRNPGPNPDYCDLVLISKLHSFVGTPRTRAVPAIDQVPAFAKLALGTLTPEVILDILKAAREQIAEAQQLLVD
jgi:HD-like signal output (HDOD) protein